MKTVEQATSRFAADLIDLIKANIRARMGATLPADGPKTSAVREWLASPPGTTLVNFSQPVVTHTLPITDSAKVLAVVKAAGKEGVKTKDAGRGTRLSQERVVTALTRWLLPAGEVKRIGRTRGTRWVATGAK